MLFVGARATEGDAGAADRRRAQRQGLEGVVLRWIGLRGGKVASGPDGMRFEGAESLSSLVDCCDADWPDGRVRRDIDGQEDAGRLGIALKQDDCWVDNGTILCDGIHAAALFASFQRRGERAMVTCSAYGQALRRQR